MIEEDLGEATIVYEGPDGTEERKVPNENVAYFQDHWIVKTGETEAGHDTVKRIPGFRVYHVERSVEEFEEEVATLADQVRSITEDLRRKLPIGAEPGGRRGGREREEAVEIDVDRGGAGEASTGDGEETDASETRSGSSSG